jgi:hypothetical protein
MAERVLSTWTVGVGDDEVLVIATRQGDVITHTEFPRPVLSALVAVQQAILDTARPEGATSDRMG